MRSALGEARLCSEGGISRTRPERAVNPPRPSGGTGTAGAEGGGGGSSVEDAVDLLDYSEREWRGNTTKSALIRQASELAVVRKASGAFEGKLFLVFVP